MNSGVFDQAMAAYDKRDFGVASELFRGLAMDGDPRAQCMLGFMYYGGEGVPQSYTRAYAWINCSAAQNYPEAILARDLLGKLLKGQPHSDIPVVEQRSGMERRCGHDRREATELAYFAQGGSQRRRFVDRRKRPKRRSSPPD